MATTTTNYGLTKPNYGDSVDIAVINGNMDKIDAKMKEIENKAGSGGGGGGSIVSYSTEEQVIGMWVDGKPLYQKTIKFEGFSIGSAKSFTYNFSDIDEVFPVDMFAKTGSGAILDLSHADDSLSSNAYVTIQKTLNNFTFWFGSNYEHTSGIAYAYVTIRYTKITD